MTQEVETLQEANGVNENASNSDGESSVQVPMLTEVRPDQ